MKNRGRLNRGIASVPSAALLVSITPAIPDICLKSYAETVTDTETAASKISEHLHITSMASQ